MALFPPAADGSEEELIESLNHTARSAAAVVLKSDDLTLLTLFLVLYMKLVRILFKM